MALLQRLVWRRMVGILIAALWVAGPLANGAKADPASDAEQAVLAANAEFYRAFAQRDVPAMEAIWSAADEIAVSHPGWPRLTGKDVMRSWRAILTNPGAPDVRVVNPVARIDGAIAVVTGSELINGGVLHALNVFVLEEDGSWRMIGHHASPSEIRSSDT